MRSKEEFVGYYQRLIEDDGELKGRQEKLQQTLNKQNPKFKAINLLARLCFIVAVVMLFFHYVLKMIVTKEGVNVAFYLILASVVVMLIALISKHVMKEGLIYDFDRKYKHQLVRYLLENSSYSYIKDSFVDRSVFINSKFFGSFNKYSGEDLVRLIVPFNEGKMEVEFSDLLVEDESTNKDGKTDTSTVFRGVFGCFYFDKKFPFSLAVNRVMQHSQKAVELESIEFNKIFRVFSSDQILARYVLTPSRMEKMLNLKCSRVLVSLIENKIYFAFHGEHLFKTVFNKKTFKINADDIYNDAAALNLMLEEVKEIAASLYR